MLRIWTISDLHMKDRALSGHDPVFDAIPAADVCVIAGDTSDGCIEDSLEWMARTILPHMPVVTVLGNHDFFGNSIQGTRIRARLRSHELGITLLDNSSATVLGTRFVGATLWSDYALFDHRPGMSTHECMVMAKYTLPDASEIDVRDGDPLRFIPRHAAEMHSASRTYIDDELGRLHDGPTIVVTHHAPHPGSVARRFKDDPITPAFVSDLSELIERRQPDAWVHGHTHDPFDYRVGKTRVVCNARGERFDRDKFDPSKVVAIEVGLDPDLTI